MIPQLVARLSSHLNRNPLIPSKSSQSPLPRACTSSGPVGVTMGTMATGLFEVECPCCKAVLKVDPDTRAVIAHAVPEKPPAIEDLAAAVAKLKGESGRRDEVFRKQFEAEKSHGKVLEKKFDELLKQAKEKPDLTPPTRDIDLD